MLLKHLIQFIKKRRLNITLFIILCILSYFIYKNNLVEGVSTSCNTSDNSSCNFNIEMMKRYDSMVNGVRKRLEKTTKYINESIQEYKNKEDEVSKDLKKQANENLKNMTQY